MPDNWDKTVAAAMKILGDKGKIPPMTGAMNGQMDKGQKSIDDVSKAVSDLQAKLVDMEKACGDVIKAGQDFKSTIDKDDLGLDPKNPDDAKKIKQARALLDAYLDKGSKGTNTSLDQMTKFDNALSSFAKTLK